MYLMTGNWEWKWGVPGDDSIMSGAKIEIENLYLQP